MSKSVNKAILIGRVGKDPKIKVSRNDVKMTSFSFATSYRKKTDTGYEDETDWHNIVCFGNIVTVIENYVSKGTQLYIEGNIKTRKWKDENDFERTITEIIANNIVILDSKKSSSNNNESKQYNDNTSGVVDANISNTLDDIPF